MAKRHDGEIEAIQTLLKKEKKIYDPPKKSQVAPEKLNIYKGAN